MPYAFTEHGVVMLSSVLKSKKAAQVSIAVVNAFIKIREYMATHKQILDKLKKHDENIFYEKTGFDGNSKRSFEIRLI